MTWRNNSTTVLLALAYVVVLFLTQSPQLGDTIDYAIEADRFDGSVWDFGHLLWVPLGWLLSQCLSPLLLPMKGGNDRDVVLLVFFALNWLAGLACILLTHAAARRLTGRAAPSAFAALALLSSHAFLNYAQTGSSYVPALAFLCLGVYLLVGRGQEALHPWRLGLAVGAALTGAVAMWFPFVLAVPATLLLPAFLFGRRGPLLLGVRCAILTALMGGVVFAAAALAMNISTLEGLREWVARSADGVSISGLSRMVFGLARSFINMGLDGLYFKRYLLGDPYNPVTLMDLLSLSLWKFALFYAALACLLLGLTASTLGRRLLPALAIGAAPVLAFGIYWQGGDIERYLPLYPLAFLALAIVFSGEGLARPLRWPPAVFFLACAVVNGLALAKPEVERQRQRLEARVAGLLGVLTPESRIVVVRDPLTRLPRDFPFDPRTRSLPMFQCVVIGRADTPWWRQEFAEMAQATWARGGDVWLSRRLLALTPHPESTWAEGDDHRVRWPDVVAFFAAMETAESTGEDGFVKLVPSPANRRLLESWQPAMP